MRAYLNIIRSTFSPFNPLNYSTVAICLLVLFLAVGCKKDPAVVDVAEIPDTATFIQMAKKFASDAGIPVTLNDIYIENENEIHDLEKNCPRYC